ncbi:MAG: selenocysteine-specific translation elongation factor [Berryella intestinalis]|uniref:selenocysteine-specific translation elongation factor n=1 Tax=Berryella intestinalis TaxID=1531429 RepID=UPI002A7554F5|nr:selenocysteine-specific translation elongation factor [Berryella intestinalis]MDY3129900.1 selenocysteine-specific translation elongation factor [Berryella intestinalis]
MAATRKVLGTAGHIDHGKSSLIQALTGTDPDRLAEEKERGITIELGFAQLQLPDGTSMGVVDVPGHERFVRQMISGSTGIDIALLCIAADDGIMPQTREHIAVLELLAVPACVIALTKSDRVDEEWIEMVSSDIRAYLTDTPFAEAPIVPTSARTGQGLDQLKSVLATEAGKGSAIHENPYARMPVDRVFTVKGAGTVVTGTLWSGSVKVGDELQVLPSKAISRVRSIQHHDQAASEASPGERTALNLSSFTVDNVRPGDFLVTPGSIEPTDRFDTRFTYLCPLKEGKPLATGTRIRIAHGTKETFGRLLLADGLREIKPNESAYAQIRLEEDLPLSSGDRYIARSYSPVAVIGGGIVLTCHPRRRTNLSALDRTLLEALEKGDYQRAAVQTAQAQPLPFTLADIARTASVPEPLAKTVLGDLVKSGALSQLRSGSQEFFVTRTAIQKTMGAIENALLAFHAKNPNEPGVHKNDLLLRCGLSMNQTAFDALLDIAAQSGKVVIDSGAVSHPKAGAGAKAAESKAAESILAVLEGGRFAPPAIPSLFDQAEVRDQSLGYRALGALEKQGAIVRVGKELAFTKESFDQLVSLTRSHLGERGSATVAELKDRLGISRKYAVPLLEEFDARGITKRSGDARVLG